MKPDLQNSNVGLGLARAFCPDSRPAFVTTLWYRLLGVEKCGLTCAKLVGMSWAGANTHEKYNQSTLKRDGKETRTACRLHGPRLVDAAAARAREHAGTSDMCRLFLCYLRSTCLDCSWLVPQRLGGRHASTPHLSNLCRILVQCSVGTLPQQEQAEQSTMEGHGRKQTLSEQWKLTLAMKTCRQSGEHSSAHQHATLADLHDPASQTLSQKG